MKDNEKIKKETAVLEAAAKNARNKNLDAKRDIANIHKQKVDIIEDVAILTREKKRLTPIVANLNKKVKDANDKIEKNRLTIEADRAKVNRDAEHNRSVAAKNEKDRVSLEKREEALKNSNIELKKGRRKLSEDIKEMQCKIDNAERLSKLYDAGILDNEKEKEAHKKKSEELDIKNNKAENTLKEIKEIKVVYEIKIKEANEEKRKAKDSMQQAENREAEANKRIADLDKREVGIKFGENKNILTAKSLATAQDAFKVKEEEFELKILRMEKAEREGTIRQELARLKKEKEEEDAKNR